MKVAIKDLAVKSLDIGSKGIEIAVNDTKGHAGDLYVTMSKIIWCKGKTGKDQGVDFTWLQIMDIAKHKEEVLSYIKKLV